MYDSMYDVCMIAWSLYINKDENVHKYAVRGRKKKERYREKERVREKESEREWVRKREMLWWDRKREKERNVVETQKGDTSSITLIDNSIASKRRVCL